MYQSDPPDVKMYPPTQENGSGVLEALPPPARTEWSSVMPPDDSPSPASPTTPTTEPQLEPWQERIHRLNGPMDEFFSLSRANYLVLHRSLIQEMPIDWQQRLVDLLDEYWSTWEADADQSFEVRVRNESGRFVADPLANYRHPSMEFIDSLRKRQP